MPSFREELQRQRWDDHRFYHHSRINQALHLVSALTFLVAYIVVFFDPAVAALLGWLVAMVARQSGHFFFEPHSYDHINDASHDHKEEIKLGYNLFRKWVLMGIWAAIPLLLLARPALFGLLTPHADLVGFVRNTGLVWLWLGVAGLLFRTVHLFFLYNVQTGLVWAAKILTDPYHDVKLYWRSPLHLLRGETIDPRYGSERAEPAG
jgi:hypothetical protein